MVEKNFWDDLDTASAHLVRDTLLGENVEEVAKEIDRSPDLLYKASHPHLPQQLNLKQWLRALKFTGNYQAVRQLGEACGFIMVSKGGDTLALLKSLIYALERNGE